MTAQFPYCRLPGIRRGLIRKASLWEGTDHLLSVKGTRFFEQYRRFYYRDIQALVLQRRARSGSIGVWLLAITLCVLFTLLGSLAINAPKLLHYSYWIINSLFFLFLVCRLVVSLKYSCRCYIQTAVTWEELPSLYRMGDAQKALDRIRTRITEAQGAFAEDPQTLAEEALALTSPRLAPTTREKTEVTEAIPATMMSMNLALLGCIALLVIAVFLFWYMDASGQSATRSGVIAANAIVTSIAGAGFSFSLFRIYKIRALHSLRNFLLAALGLIGLHVYFSTLLSRLYSLQSDPVSVALSSPAFRRWFSLIDGSFSLLFGIFGVALIVLNWQNYSRGQVSNS